jgi:hypothetical protein
MIDPECNSILETLSVRDPRHGIILNAHVIRDIVNKRVCIYLKDGGALFAQFEDLRGDVAPWSD